MKSHEGLTVLNLIDEAATLCGSQSALARALGVSPQRVSAWKTQTEPISPEDVGLLCDLLGLPGAEARRLAALAVVENPKNAKKADRLRRAFFVSWLAGAVAMPLQMNDADAHEIAGGYGVGPVDRLHIVRTQVIDAGSITASWRAKARLASPLPIDT